MKRRLNIIGQGLKQLRIANNLTQTELAAKCGILGWDIERITITKIENFTRSVYDAEIILLAKALKIDVSELVPKQINEKWLISCLNKPRR